MTDALDQAQNSCDSRRALRKLLSQRYGRRYQPPERASSSQLSIWTPSSLYVYDH